LIETNSSRRNSNVYPSLRPSQLRLQTRWRRHQCACGRPAPAGAPPVSRVAAKHQQCAWLAGAQAGCRASLNIAGGGELAENLSNLYDYCIVQLTKANAFNDDALLVEVRGLIETVAQSWQEISPKGAGASNRS
jgi:hypothetical protein